jgi:hypothetical protein
MTRRWNVIVPFLLAFLAVSGKPAFSQVGSSNIQLIQSVECEPSGVSGSYACTLTPTGAGHLLTAQEFDFADTPGTPATPAGWTQDCVKNNGSAGQITFYSYPNAPAGIASVTFTPSSGASSAVVSEWSGMATSSPFDGCDGYVDNGAKGAYWFSGAKLSSQTDLAIGAALNRTNSANGFAPGDVWTPLTDAPQTFSGAEGWTAYIANGLQSPFTALGTTTSAVDVLSSVALYKSAVAGAAPTGALVSSYSDFESGSNGDAVTAAILNAGTHGAGINQWALNDAGAFSVCTAGNLPSYTNATTNGTTYAAGAGTRGICFDMASGGQAYETVPAGNLAVTAYVNVNVGSNVTSYSSPVIIEAPEADAAAFTINSSGQLALDCSFANPVDYPISPVTLAVANTTYGIWLQYVGGGMHTVKIYSNPTSNPQLIGTATCPAQGSNDATEVGIGEFYAGAAGPAGTREFDSLMWDSSGAGINIVPPGNTVSSFSDFENGSNGNSVTTAILNAGTYGAGVNQWSADAGAFTVCNSGSMPTFLQTTVIGGPTYPPGAGTRGICYNMMNGGEALENINSKTVTLYMNVNLGADVTHYSNPVIIGNFGVDDAAFTIKWTGQLELECPFANPEDYVISGANQAQANTPYGIWLQYDSAGGHHTIKIYSNPATDPQLIGTATCPAQGSTAATTLGFGEFHGGAVGLTGIRSFDSLLWDVSGRGIDVIPSGNTVQVSVGTNPAGLSYSVDGTAYSSPQFLTWTIGTSHTLTTTASQNPAAGTQDNFVNWSDGTTTASDTVTATSGTTSFTANFGASYQLTTSVSPAAGGTVSPATGAYYAQGTSVPLTATPNATYSFSSWTGNVVSSSSASTTITMNAPLSVTANFATQGLAPAITSASSATFTVNAAGSFTVTATGTPAPSITETGALPAGVSFNTATQVLSGTPAAGTAKTYTITFTASNGVGTNSVQSFTLTVANPPAPTLSSVAPNSGQRATSVPVMLTGTNFTATGTTLGVSGTGVTASGVTVVNSTTITATFTISASAAVTARNVSVSNAGGASNTQTFTVLGPVLSAVAPNSGVRGTSVPVTLTGTGLTGATAITVSGTGVTSSGLTVVNDTTVSATFAISTSASTGSRSVSITTTPGGTSNTVTFTVLAPPTPTLTSVAPASGLRGSAVPVTLTGTNFATTGTTVSVSGSGVTVSATTVVNSTTITATFTISTTASASSRTVKVSTPGGTSGSRTFTVQGPTLASIRPTSGTHGTTVSVTLTGTNLAGATAVTISGSGVNCTGITSTATTVNASCAISSVTTRSARSVTVTTPIGTTNTLSRAFTVN